jgi:hypothetical protein
VIEVERREQVTISRMAWPSLLWESRKMPIHDWSALPGWDGVHQVLWLKQPTCPAPFAVAYRVGAPAPSGGRFLALWRRTLAVGSALPTMGLPLTVKESVTVDLEATYSRAAEAAYLHD